MVPSDPVMIQGLRRQRGFAIALAVVGSLLLAINTVQLFSGFDWMDVFSGLAGLGLGVLSGLRAMHLTAMIHSAMNVSR